MSAYDDYSNAHFDDNYEEPKDTDTFAKDQYQNNDIVDLRIPASIDELDAREEALIALEKNLIEKSKQLRDRESMLEGSGVVEDNWPCACYPITYHSITNEIPIQHQSFVRRHYWILKLTIFAFVWNFLTMLIMYIENEASATTLTWASLYLITGVPGAWKMWYKAIYRAVGTDSRLKFLQYFFFCLCHTFFCMTAAIGVPQTAMMGFLLMLKAMDINTACGICGVLSFACWVTLSVCSILMLRQTYKLYKSRGGDLQKDSAALKSDVADNVAAGRMVLQGVNAAR